MSKQIKRADNSCHILEFLQALWKNDGLSIFFTDFHEKIMTVSSFIICFKNLLFWLEERLSWNEWDLITTVTTNRSSLYNQNLSRCHIRFKESMLTLFSFLQSIWYNAIVLRVGKLLYHSIVVNICM